MRAQESEANAKGADPKLNLGKGNDAGTSGSDPGSDAESRMHGDPVLISHSN